MTTSLTLTFLSNRIKIQAQADISMEVLIAIGARSRFWAPVTHRIPSISALLRIMRRIRNVVALNLPLTMH